MPRFRNLSANAIYEKRPGEVVTEADTAAEAWLEPRLSRLIPGSFVVGEENSEHDPGLLGRLDHGPVWVVDPVDGTQNFANGSTCFAVMVALLRDGETVAGWIYNPVDDVMCRAVRNSGVTIPDGATSPRSGLGIADLRGGLDRRARSAASEGGGAMPSLIKRYRCVGREYLDLAAGHLDFLQFGSRLKPWDHLAGVLIAEEAGYTVALAGTGEPYAPAQDGIVRGNLICAPDAATWDWIEGLIR